MPLMMRNSGAPCAHTYTRHGMYGTFERAGGRGDYYGGPRGNWANDPAPLPDFADFGRRKEGHIGENAGQMAPAPAADAVLPILFDAGGAAAASNGDTAGR